MTEDKDVEVTETEPVEDTAISESVTVDNTPTEEIETAPAETTPKEEVDDNRRDDNRQGNQNVIDWRKLRDKADKAERERDDAVRRLQESQGDNNRRTSPKQQQQLDDNRHDEEFVIGDDDLLEGKHFKSLEKKQSQRIAQLEAQVIESKIRSTYPDFDEVVNNETISMLKDADPELAESIASNRNLHSQAVTAYKSIKRYGFVENKKHNDINKQAIAKNSNKPRTVTSIAPQQGDSPLSRANAFANGLTDELKEQRWKEAKEIIRNY